MTTGSRDEMKNISGPELVPFLRKALVAGRLYETVACFRDGLALPEAGKNRVNCAALGVRLVDSPEASLVARLFEPGDTYSWASKGEELMVNFVPSNRPGMLVGPALTGWNTSAVPAECGDFTERPDDRAAQDYGEVIEGGFLPGSKNPIMTLSPLVIRVVPTIKEETTLDDNLGHCRVRTFNLQPLEVHIRGIPGSPSVTQPPGELSLLSRVDGLLVELMVIASRFRVLDSRSRKLGGLGPTAVLEGGVTPMEAMRDRMEGIRAVITRVGAPRDIEMATRVIRMAPGSDDS